MADYLFFCKKNRAAGRPTILFVFGNKKKISYFFLYFLCIPMYHHLFPGRHTARTITTSYRPLARDAPQQQQQQQ
jgi:hypothetical protein